MWRILVSSLLLVAAAGQPQLSGFSSAALDIAGGYLPPGRGQPDNPTPNVLCLPAKTFYRTETQRITNTVYRTLIQSVPQVIEKTSVVTQAVPTTVNRIRTTRVESPVVRTQVESSVVQRVEQRTVSVPGNTRVVTETDVRTQLSYKTDVRVVERTQVVTVTQVKTSNVVQRVTETVTQRVPQVVYVTRTVQVPGRLQVVTRTEQRRTTAVEQYQPDPVTSVRNEVKYATSVVLRRVDGQVITVTRDVVRTQVIQKTSVQRVPRVSTSIVQQNKEVVRTVTQTNVVTSVQVKYITNVRSVPVYVTQTQERLVTVPLVLTSTVTAVRSVQGPNVVRTTVRNQDRVKTVRGPDSVTTRYRDVDRVVTQVVTSIRIRPSVVTQVVSRTEPCKKAGYSYDEPSKAFNF